MDKRNMKPQFDPDEEHRYPKSHFYFHRVSYIQQQHVLAHPY
jgi:hypothetical protein